MWYLSILQLFDWFIFILYEKFLLLINSLSICSLKFTLKTNLQHCYIGLTERNITWYGDLVLGLIRGPFNLRLFLFSTNAVTKRYYVRKSFRYSYYIIKSCCQLWRTIFRESTIKHCNDVSQVKKMIEVLLHGSTELY